MRCYRQRRFYKCKWRPWRRGATCSWQCAADKARPNAESGRWRWRKTFPSVQYLLEECCRLALHTCRQSDCTRRRQKTAIHFSRLFQQTEFAHLIHVAGSKLIQGPKYIFLPNPSLSNLSPDEANADKHQSPSLHKDTRVKAKTVARRRSRSREFPPSRRVPNEPAVCWLVAIAARPVLRSSLRAIIFLNKIGVST